MSVSRARRRQREQVGSLLANLLERHVEVLRQLDIAELVEMDEFVVRQQATSGEVLGAPLAVGTGDAAGVDAQREVRHREDPPTDRVVWLEGRDAGIELDAVAKHRSGWMVEVAKD